MKKVKYYYSSAVSLRNLPVFTDSQGNVLYVFDKPLVETKKIPRVTVASVYDPVENRMTFGVAVCCPKDTFEKHIGRDIALQRAIETPEVTVRLIKRGRIREISKRYANQLINSRLKSYVQSDL